MHTRGRRLASDGVRSVTDRSLQKKHRRQAASYQTTCKPLKKLDFVGADLSAKRPVHSTHMRWLKHCIRGQVRSYQTTYNLLKKLGFVGADRATFRLSAKRPVHPTHSRTSPLPRRPVFDARQRYVEDVVAPPTVRGRSASAWVGGTRHQDTADFSSRKSPLVLPAGRFSRSVLVPAC